jgi:hypothetical protein
MTRFLVNPALKYERYFTFFDDSLYNVTLHIKPNSIPQKRKEAWKNVNEYYVNVRSKKRTFKKTLFPCHMHSNET